MASILPFQSAPNDALRNGLASLKADAAMKHPVQCIQDTGKQHINATQFQMLRDLYGIAAPAKLQIETQILDRFQRLPGIPSSKLGLEALTGDLDEFRFESYLGLPEVSDDVPTDVHSVMEQRLGLAPVTKPMARGML